MVHNLQQVKVEVTVEELILMMPEEEEEVLALLDLLEMQVEMVKELAVQQMEIFTCFHMQEVLEEVEAHQTTMQLNQIDTEVLEVVGEGL